MKSIYLFALISILASCSKPSEKMMLVTGEITGLKKGTIILQKLVDTSLVSIDSVVVNGESLFSFSEEIESPEVRYIYLRKDGSSNEDRILFFAEPGEIKLTASLDKFGLDTEVTGSQNHNRLEEYRKLMKRYSDKNLSLIEDSFNASKSGNDSLLAAFRNQQNRLLATRYLATVNFALTNKDKEIAPYLMLTEAYDANIKYLDTIYTSLTPKIKDSKYGKALESFIKERKK